MDWRSFPKPLPRCSFFAFTQFQNRFTLFLELLQWPPPPPPPGAAGFLISMVKNPSVPNRTVSR